jgi:hypothetical protein
MKKTAFLALCLLVAGGLPSPAMAGHFVTQANGRVALQGPISPRVQDLLAAYPNGGKGLEDAVRNLLVDDPSLADDVVAVANLANPGQQAAFASGFADAVVALRAAGSANVSMLTQAATHFTPAMYAQYSNALAVAEANQGDPDDNGRRNIVGVFQVQIPVSIH